MPLCPLPYRGHAAGCRPAALPLPFPSGRGQAPHAGLAETVRQSANDLPSVALQGDPPVRGPALPARSQYQPGLLDTGLRQRPCGCRPFRARAPGLRGTHRDARTGRGLCDPGLPVSGPHHRHAADTLGRSRQPEHLRHHQSRGLPQPHRHSPQQPEAFGGGRRPAGQPRRRGPARPCAHPLPPFQPLARIRIALGRQLAADPAPVRPCGFRPPPA